jgi:TPR repeat protein
MNDAGGSMYEVMGDEELEGLAGKWLALSADAVLELVLFKDRTGMLKHYDETGKVNWSMVLEVYSRNKFLMSTAGRPRLFTYERREDGSRLAVRLSGREERVFTKEAPLIREVCGDKEPDRLLRLGNYYFLTGSVKCGVLLYTEAARLGSGQGNLYLGNYYQGRDKERAFACYVKAAEQGVGEVELHLARVYWTGDGGSQDRHKAMTLCARAVEHGSREAEAFWEEINKIAMSKDN